MLVEAAVEVQAVLRVVRLEPMGKAEQQQAQQGAERLEPKHQKAVEVRGQEPRKPPAVQQVVAYQPQGAQAVLLELCRLLH